jgi:hypothetical protein
VFLDIDVELEDQGSYPWEVELNVHDRRLVVVQNLVGDVDSPSVVLVMATVSHIRSSEMTYTTLPRGTAAIWRIQEASSTMIDSR